MYSERACVHVCVGVWACIFLAGQVSGGLLRLDFDASDCIYTHALVRMTISCLIIFICFCVVISHCPFLIPGCRMSPMYACMHVGCMYVMYVYVCAFVRYATDIC